MSFYNRNRKDKKKSKTLLTLVIAIFTVCTGCTHDSDGLDETICFIGDSITHLWDLESCFPNKVIVKHAVMGAVVQDFDKWDIRDCAGRKAFVLIGTNNIGSFVSQDETASSRRQYFMGEYIKRIVAIDADPLIAVSILPRNSQGKQDTTVNINIQLQNEMIKNSIDSLGEGYDYLDAYDGFIEIGHKVRMDLFKDGLHPNENGYYVLAKYVRKKL